MSNNINKRRGGPTQTKKKLVLTKPKKRYAAIMELSRSKIPRELAINQLFPPYELVTHQIHQQQLLVSAVNGYALYEYKMNDLFRTDPLVAGNVPGFASCATRYQIYRVMEFLTSITAVNLSATLPISACVIFRDAQPSVDIVSYATATNAESTGFASKAQLIGTVSGQNRVEFNLPWVELGDVIGQYMTYYTEQGYEGTNILSPTQTVWMAIVVRTLSAANPLANGVNVLFDNRYKAQWHSGANIIL